jgi:LysM repeat protein
MQNPVPRFLLLALVILLAGLFPARLMEAQATNILQNPGFEGTYIAFNGDQTRLVAPGWSAWNLPHKTGEPGFTNLQPNYRAAANANRIHGGSSAQEFFTFFATHTGGVFQQVSVTQGSKLRFSAFINVWSTALDDPNRSPEGQRSRYSVRVGIDPTGGTDGASPNIVWSQGQEFYDEYRELSVEATASSGTVTVFVESAPKEPVKNNNTYVDDATLIVTEQPSGPTAQPTVRPTEIVVVPTTAATTAVPTTAPPTVAPPATSTPNPFEPTREGTIIPPTAGSAQPTVPPSTPNFPTPTPGGTQSGSISDLPGRVVYTVQSGDTLIAIAARFNSRVDAIITANGLDSSGLIFVGQQLVIPVPTAPPTAVPPTVTQQTGGGGGSAPVDTAPLTGPTVNGIGTYIVQPGDDLEHIARRYGITVQALAQLNGIVNPNSIVIGQVLVVPGPGNNYPGGTIAPTVIPTRPGQPAGQPTQPGGQPGQPGRTHVVQPGENLFRISLQYGVTLDALMRANGISNPNLIYVGQVLRIP